MPRPVTWYVPRASPLRHTRRPCSAQLPACQPGRPRGGRGSSRPGTRLKCGDRFPVPASTAWFGPNLYAICTKPLGIVISASTGVFWIPALPFRLGRDDKELLCAVQWSSALASGWVNRPRICASLVRGDAGGEARGSSSRSRCLRQPHFTSQVSM